MSNRVADFRHLHNVATDGFAIVRGVVPEERRRELLAQLGPVSGAGRRGILAVSAVAELARLPHVLALIRPHLSAEPLPVRAIYFDKSAEANWLVPWHQDLTVAFQSRAEVPGFGPWSVKDGIPHVQPPVGLLEQMISVRLHFDDADASNGALRVIPGSHRRGRLSAAEIERWRAGGSDVLCPASAGDAVLMRPLLLHASRRSTSAAHRRVLHIEYAGFSLPPEFAWNEAA